MNLRKWLILILFFAVKVCLAQNEANIWYFGQNLGLDFNSGTPAVLLDGALNTREGCATISDVNGGLLFYTDGSFVYNKNHQQMPNGFDLKGNFSSTHSAIIVPKPDNSNIYYIFTIDEEAGPDGLNYSEVDITADGGLGDVVVKNISLVTPTTEKITAIQQPGLNKYWVVSHKWMSNEFIAYEVNASGVNTTPITSAVGTTVTGSNKLAAAGAIKISPDGSKLAVARGPGLSEVQLFVFNATTGVVSNPLTILDLADTKLVYGVAFSPNSKILYVSVGGEGVFQYNLEAGSPSDIVNSKLLLSPTPTAYAAMQIATDGKIYIARFDNQYLDTIDNPNVVGPGCNYNFESIYLEGRLSQSGLPPFIQSFFQIDDIQFENTCFGGMTSFALSDTVDSVSWNFGDPTSGSNNTSTAISPSHQFTSPGAYTVTADVLVNGQSATATTTVTIHAQPIANTTNNILQCDTNNDGFFDFNLKEQDIEVLNGQDPGIFEVSYYASPQDVIDQNPISSPTSYTNQSAYITQTIYVTVVNRQNSDCIDQTSFEITVFDSPLVNTNLSDLRECDTISFGTDTDGQNMFDLTENENTLLNGQDPNDFDIDYFKDVALTIPIVNPSNYINTNPLESIYLQISNYLNVNCKAFANFEIEVLALPVVNSPASLIQCDDDLDGISRFNLFQATPQLTNITSGINFAFFETLAQAEGNASPITNPNNYQNQTPFSDKIWARVENTNDCFRIAELNLTVSATQIPVSFFKAFYECDDAANGNNTDGISTFDFSSVTVDLLNLFPSGQQLSISYHESQQEALLEQNAIDNISNYRNENRPFRQDIFIRIEDNNNECIGLGNHISLNVESFPILNEIVFPDQCDDTGSGVAAFDITDLEIQLSDDRDLVFVYTDQGGVELPSPLPNPFVTGSQTIQAEAYFSNSLDPDGPCISETTIHFIVDDAVVAFPIADLVTCETNIEDSGEFDTSQVENIITGNQTNILVRYFDENGVELSSPLPNPFISQNSIITARVENLNNPICYDEVTFNLVVLPQPDLGYDTFLYLCSDVDNLDLTVPNIYDFVEWSTGEITESITIVESGTYIADVGYEYNGFRCSDTKSFIVGRSEPPIISNVEVIDWTSSNNSITVEVMGSGDYEYAIDGFSFQDSPTFEDLEADDYIVLVRDKNGCGSDIKKITVAYYSPFFTPNGDGYNDHWNVDQPSIDPIIKVVIFDRFGKLIKQMESRELGWDGTYNGNPMPTSNFWFYATRQSGKRLTGYFSLIRK